MTWMGVVITLTMISAFVALIALSLLGASLRTQGPDTSRQTSNRRLLAVTCAAFGAALLIPILLKGVLLGLFVAVGLLVLTGLNLAMFSARRGTRLLAVLLFLTFSLIASVGLPPHRSTADILVVFVVGGLLLAKFTRVAIHWSEKARQLG